MKKLAVLMLLGPVAAGCASAQAKSPVDRPNLEVPAPPPRVIESMAVFEAPPPEPVPDLPAASPTSPRPRTVPPARESKPDPKPETPPAEPPVAATPPAAPATVPQLRTPGTVDGAEAARQIKEVIDSAKRMLGLIDYRPLNAQSRAQYDSANLFITQSEDALKSQNYDLAKGLADKADRLAKELRGR